MLTRCTSTLLILATALLLAACGGDNDSSSSDAGASKETTEETADEGGEGTSGGGDEPATAGGQTLELGVDGNNLKFDKETLTATAGSITLQLDNTSSIPHNVAIEDGDGKSLDEGEIVGQGEQSTVTVDLEPGEYTYYCSPHKSSGMTGKLTVT